MFQPQFRLHYSWEYRKFFNQSQHFKTSECWVFRIPNDFGHYRLGITIKAKANSVYRNQIKRQIRAVIMQMGQDLGPYDYNIVIPGHKKIDYRYPKKLALCLRHELVKKITL